MSGWFVFAHLSHKNKSMRKKTAKHYCLTWSAGDDATTVKQGFLPEQLVAVFDLIPPARLSDGVTGVTPPG